MKYMYEFVRYDKNIPGRILAQDKPGWRCNTTPHWHPELEFVYVFEGILRVTRAGTTCQIGPGEFYFCNSEVIHSTAATDNTGHYRYVVLLLSRDEVLRFHPNCTFQIPEGEPRQKLAERLCYLMHLEENAGTSDFNTDIEKNKVILDILQILISSCATTSDWRLEGRAEKNSYARQVMAYVRANFTEPLTLPDIAKQVGLSPQYLAKYFKHATGIGIMQYVNHIRLDCANSELLNDNTTIANIAMENGFPNVKAYIKQCRETYGMTPSEFRKAMRGEA